MVLVEEANSEKKFLLSVLSIAGDREHQEEFLKQLRLTNFSDPFYCCVFEGFCRIVNSGRSINLLTMAKYFRAKSDCATFKRVCKEMQVYEYIIFNDDAAISLQNQVDNLWNLTTDRKFREAG